EPRVGGDDGQAVSGLEPASHEPAAQLFHLTPQLPVRGHPALADERCRALGVAVDDRREIHPKNAPCSLSDRCRSSTVSSSCARSAAAVPAAWPSTIEGAITRVDANASWSAEMHRPATNRLVGPCGC